MAIERHPYDTHYTATIKMSKVERFREAQVGRAPHADASIKRDVTQSEVVVRARNLADLQRKVNAHVNLLDEQDLNDTEKDIL